MEGQITKAQGQGRRQYQQDRWSVWTEGKSTFLAVADGMGGEDCGDKFAEAAIRGVEATVPRQGESWEDHATRAFIKAQKEAKAIRARGGAALGLVRIREEGDRILVEVAWNGDIRCVTVNRLKARATEPQRLHRHVLVTAIGTEEYLPKVGQTILDANGGPYLVMIGSDGVMDPILDDKSFLWVELLVAENPAEKALEMAEARDDSDNATVLAWTWP